MDSLQATAVIPALNTNTNSSTGRKTIIDLAESSRVTYRRKIPESRRLIPAHQTARYPQSAVALEVVENATLVCAHRTIVAYYPDGQPIESCQIGDTERAFRIKGLRKRLDLEGSLALFTSLAPECYYHWLMDTLPGLEVLAAAGEAPDAVNHFYFSNFSQKFQSDTLLKYGIDESKVLSTFTDIDYSDEQLLHAKVDRLLIPRFRDLDGGWPNQWIAPRLQKRFDACKHWTHAHCKETEKKSAAGLKKIYVTRGTSRRRVLNENKLQPLLRESGFEIVDMSTLTFADQIKTAASADVICGPHGAGLATAIFAQPGARLIEFCGCYVTRHFRIVAEIASLDYHVFGAGIDGADQPLAVTSDVADRSANYRINIDQVINTLNGLAHTDS